MLVNVSIFDSSCSITLLGWTIEVVEDERESVATFYDKCLSLCTAEGKDHLKRDEHVLEDVRIGKSKDDLDRVGNTSKSKR